MRKQGSFVTRFVVLTGMTVALLAAAACGGSTQGQGTSTTTGASASDIGSSEATTSSGSGNGSLPSDACSLMTPGEALQLHSTDPGGKGTAGTIAGSPNCEWAFGTTSAGVTIFTDRGISQLNVTGPVTDLGMIGSHHAQQRTDSANTSVCDVAFALTPTSSVMVTVQEAPSVPTTQVCQGAMKIATVVEKHLPSS